MRHTTEKLPTGTGRKRSGKRLLTVGTECSVGKMYKVAAREMYIGRSPEADIFIDESPQDGMMDDLNGDGTIDYRDAAVLYKLFDDLYGDEDYEPFMGGLGRYKKTASHGPFVHVDVRGFRARWGT